jgi:hypothetical protein
MDKDLLIKVRKFIGMPPRAVLFTQIQKHTGASDDDLSAVLDKLWENEEIDLWNEAWIAGRPKSNLPDKLSKDDLEWLTGTGRYGQ